MIDHVNKLIFIHIARTGGTSIETALVDKDWWLIDRITKHLSASQARAHYGDVIWKKYTKFTVIRNPWDRLVSMWATGWWHESSNMANDVSFGSFIRKVKPHPHELYDSLFYHEIIDDELDYILRFENLSTDFNNMLNVLDMPSIKLPHKENREHEHYTTFYNDDLIDLVSDLYNKDIELFNYAFR